MSEKLKKYTLYLVGCDDVSKIYINLTDSEYKLFLLLEEKTNELFGWCQPTIWISVWTVIETYSDWTPCSDDEWKLIERF